MSWLLVYIILEWTLRIVMTPVILGRQFAPGAAVAWLGIIYIHPVIGFTLYMLVGETRLGPNRVERHRELVHRYRGLTPPPSADAESKVTEALRPMVRQATNISSLSVVDGNAVELLGDSPEMIRRLTADIDAATQRIHLLYYIIGNDESGGAVVDALIRAAQRGIKCRLLADGIGSRDFLHRRGLSSKLRNAGVSVAVALPVAPIQRRLPRVDMRNHRKLGIIDGQIGYCGSQNLINADYGGRRGAPWVDLTARFTGSVAHELELIFAEDWAFETGEMLEVPSPAAIAASSESGPAASLMQLVPTGPTSPDEHYRRVLLGAIQCAQRRIVLTSPYFVPDEPTLVGLMIAADRGVDVRLIMPRVADHFFTAAAGRSHFRTLLNSGIHIHLFNGGLLHAKTVLVDESLAMVGSANLDVRSFNLNFELTVLMYGGDAIQKLQSWLDQCLAKSDLLDPKVWNARSTLAKYADSAISLLSPLL
jgi:cardiolipin synthase